MSAKRDRPAYFDIDEKTLEYTENPDKNQEMYIDSQQKIGQRKQKIYKIKMPGEVNQDVTASKPKFNLFGNESKPKQAQKRQQNKNKDSEATQPAENKQQKLFQQQKKEPEKKQQERKATGLFSFGQNGLGIFSNGIKLFSDNENGGGLFSANNIFGKKDPMPPKTEQSKPTNSIFGTSQSIFSANSITIPKTAQTAGDEDSEDSQQLEKVQNQTVDPTKSTGNYKYYSNCVILFQVKALKIKKNNGELVENVEVIIEQDSQKKTNWIVVRLAATKNPIVIGILMKGKSEIRKIGNKDENVTLSVLVISQKIPQRHVLKIQFETPQEGKSFLQLVQTLII